MAQQPESLFDAMPCPECGSQHLIQHINQSEDVHVDGDGEIEYIEPRDSIDVRELWCPECDEKIWEAEGEDGPTIDVRFTTEGFSMSVYGDENEVLEESWFTWDEINGMKSDEESHITVEL